MSALPIRLTRLPDRRSVRMAGFDYAKAGAYFVTICTAGRRCVLGAIHEGVLSPSPLGTIVAEEWARSGEVRSEIRLDAFTLMPNHVHGIVWIGDGVLAERTWDRPSKPGGTRSRSLSSFVQGFKAAVTSRAVRERVWPAPPVWQRGFFEHMIRTERSLAIIRRYTAMNPRLWGRDGENPDRVRPHP